MSEQWKRFLRRATARLPRLTRRGRLVRNLICAVLLGGLCYVLLGAPPLTEKQALHQAERQNMLEPSEIIDVIDVSWEGFNYDRLMVAENDEGYILYDPKPPARLVYREKGERVTLMAPPVSVSFIGDQGLFLFTELPAVRGQLELMLNSEIIGIGYPEDGDAFYQVDAERSESGYFLFVLSSAGKDEKQRYRETLLVRYFVRRLHGESSGSPIPVTIRLWDETGALIYEETLIYRTWEEEP